MRSECERDEHGPYLLNEIATVEMDERGNQRIQLADTDVCVIDSS